MSKPTAETRQRPSAVRLSLVLPAFNEAEGIVAAVEEADTVLAGFADEHEILVVDDGSRDGTGDQVRGILPSHPAVRLLSHPANRRYGAALRTGFAAARLPLVAYTDADRQFDLRDLLASLDALDGQDMVTCYRRGRKDSRLRCAYSKVFNLLAFLLLGFRVRDCDCSLKLFRRELLGEMDLRESGFLIDAEILGSAHGLQASVAEIGVTHRPRAAGQSTVSVWHAIPVLAGLWSLRARLRSKALEPIARPTSVPTDAEEILAATAARSGADPAKS